MLIQCASIAIRIHTSTQLPWHPRQIFTSASHHIASRVEQIRGTQCVAQRSALTVDERTRHALFGPYAQRAIARSSSIRIETTSGSGLGLIRIRSGLGECAFSVNALKPDSIRSNVHWVSSVNRPLDDPRMFLGPPTLLSEYPRISRILGRSQDVPGTICAITPLSEYPRMFLEPSVQLPHCLSIPGCSWNHLCKDPYV